MSHDVSAMAQEGVHTVAHNTKQAVVSYAWLYPPLGVTYLLTHRPLWPPVTSRILPCLGLAAVVVSTTFFFLYLPQAAILTLTGGPLGPINAVMLTLSESTFIITWIARNFMLQGALIDLFDATLVSEGCEELVKKGREVKPGNKLGGVNKLGKVLSKPMQRFSTASLLEYVALLPLNLVPFVGTAAFLIIQGNRMGPSFHARYFQLKGFSDDARAAHVKANHGAYIAFGTANAVMNLIPLVTIFFTFTTTVGAALWAAQDEKGLNTQMPLQNMDVLGHNLKGDEHKKEL